ncbi:hypothetical protein [Lysinibacillus parviboronicapiens]
MSIFYVSERLGHSNIDITTFYVCTRLK